jgi:hypothetical protein
VAYEDELRLAYAVAINAFVLACAYRFVRARVGGDFVQRWIDTLLLYYAVQYCSIMIPGLLGALHPFSIAAVAGWLGVSLLTGAYFLRLPTGVEVETKAADERGSRIFVACALFVIGFAAALVHQQRYLPPFANDPLTYHLPAAVQWLQSGRVGLFETWFFNPANTYSPLGGSTFIAWLLAPTGNHVLARFVQVGPLLLLFLLLIEVGRALGASTSLASIVAAAAVLSRPFVSQAILPKDDLFVTAFAVAGVLALCGPRAGERWGPWRAGGAIGLLLAMKYTVLFAAPILLLVIDGPIRRWRLRDWVFAGAVVLLFAVPWYVRNWWLTGNPLFPIDHRVGGWRTMPGMFASARSEDLQTWSGVAHVLTRGYYSIPPVLAGITAGAWIVLLIALGRDAVRKPLPRACIFGSVLSIAAFLVAAPFGEVRFIHPAIALFMGGIAGAIASWIKYRTVAMVIAASLFVTAVITCGFPREDKITFAIVGTVAAGIGVLIVIALERQPRLARRALFVTGAFATLLAVGFTYVNWRAYLDQLVIDEHYAWSQGYGKIADAWDYARRELPPDATIAYANTHFVYPLQGERLTRRVVYAPVRPGVERMTDLPPIPGRISGERIVPLVLREMVKDADRETWLANLSQAGAGYLFVAKGGEATAPEAGFAGSDPSRFTRLFENEAATIYRVNAGVGPVTRSVE